MDKFRLVVVDGNERALTYNNNKYTSLAFIDRYTSSKTKEEFINALLKNGIINSKNVEFYITDGRKKYQVVFDNKIVNFFSHLETCNVSDELKEKYYHIYSNELLSIINRESKVYNGLTAKNEWKNLDWVSSKIVSDKTISSKYREKISHRIVGIYYREKDIFVKSGNNYDKNYFGILNYFETSYPDFRNTYIINSKELIDADNLLNETLGEDQISFKSIKDNNEVNDESYNKTYVNDNKTVYNFTDFLNILTEENGLNFVLKFNAYKVPFKFTKYIKNIINFYEMCRRYNFDYSYDDERDSGLNDDIEFLKGFYDKNLENFQVLCAAYYGRPMIPSKKHMCKSI